MITAFRQTRLSNCEFLRNFRWKLLRLSLYVKIAHTGLTLFRYERIYTHLRKYMRPGIQAVNEVAQPASACACTMHAFQKKVLVKGTSRRFVEDSCWARKLPSKCAVLGILGTACCSRWSSLVWLGVLWGGYAGRARLSKIGYKHPSSCRLRNALDCLLPICIWILGWLTQHFQHIPGKFRLNRADIKKKIEKCQAYRSCFYLLRSYMPDV